MEISLWSVVLYTVFGLCGGGLVAAGLYAFINVLGLVPRLAARTHTASKIHRYEMGIVAGALFGNMVNLHQISLQWLWNRMDQVLPGMSLWICRGLAGILGISSGIFVGCLVMSLAETLDALPTMSRRIHLSVGIQYVIESLAVGKLVGSLLYFWFQIAH